MTFKIGDPVFLKRTQAKGKIEAVNPFGRTGFVIVRLEGQGDGYMFPTSEVILDKEISK